VPEAVGGRSASRGHYMARPSQAKTNAEFARKRSHHSRGHTEQTHLLVLLMKEEPVLLLGEFLRPAARSQNYSEAPLLFQWQRISIDSRIPQRFRGRGHGQRQHP